MTVGSWEVNKEMTSMRGKTTFIKDLLDLRNFECISKPCSNPQSDGDNQPGYQFSLYFKLGRILHLNQFPVFHIN